MSIKAVAWAIETRVGDPALKVLLIAIANYAQADGSCWPKVETLAYDSEVSKRTIQRRIAELGELGLIKITPRFNQAGKQLSSRYDVLMEEIRGDKTRGDKLAPPDSDMVGVTSSCHGEGDNMVSPTESLERSIERSIEQDSSPSLSLGDENGEFSLEPCVEGEVLTKQQEAELFFDKQFWPAYPERFGRNPKEPAKKKIVACIVKGEDPKEILAGVNRLFSGMQRGGKIGTQYVPMAVTWINGKGWKDDPMPAGNGKAANEVSFFDIGREAWDRVQEHDARSDHNER